MSRGTTRSTRASSAVTSSFNSGSCGGGFGPPLRDPTLRRRVAASILAPPERRVLDDEVDARLLADTSPDFAEERRQVLGRLGTAVDHGEVQILGKPVSLVGALAQAGTALEHPGRAELRVVRDACQQPAKDVVLLDDPDVERPLCSQVQDLPGGITTVLRGRAERLLAGTTG